MDSLDLSKIVPGWVGSGVALSVLVQVSPEASRAVQLLAKAEEWTYKLSALTQDRPDKIRAFLAENYDAAIPSPEFNDFLLESRKIIKQVERFNWIAEKLFRYYSQTGELPKKDDPLEIIWEQSYIPVDWNKLAEEVAKIK